METEIRSKQKPATKNDLVLVFFFFCFCFARRQREGEGERRVVWHAGRGRKRQFGPPFTPFWSGDWRKRGRR